MSELDALDELAHLAGVAAEYEDTSGRIRRTPRKTVETALTALGFCVESEHRIQEEVRRLRTKPWSRPLEPVYVVRDTGEVMSIPFVVPQSARDDKWKWALVFEDGSARTGTVQPCDLRYEDEATVNGLVVERRWLDLPIIPSGYHQLTVTWTGPADPMSVSTKIICVPRKAYMPEDMKHGRRIWGFALQLYGLRSERNWGIGDFTDLRDMVRKAGEAGAEVIGLNPLHASFLAVPSQCGPYSASSRLFLNPLYLDIEALPDFLGCTEARTHVESDAFQQRLDGLRDGTWIDYPGVAQAKLSVLELIFERFMDNHLGPSHQVPLTPHGAEFVKFIEEQGEPLRRYALYEALCEHFRSSLANPTVWQSWPPVYQDPESREVAAFAQSAADRVRFFQYLQWLAQDQLSEVHEYCGAMGVTLRLYGDLALGTLQGSADTWAEQKAYVTSMSMGAPPDAFNQKGQDWELPPMHPGILAETAFAPFITVLRASMRFAGALRIDHVLGLARLFWVPVGSSPDQGGYIRYPLDALIGLIALESQRNKCLIIGEDLGTVSPELRGKLWDADILSYRVLFFERNEHGGFRRPDEYPDLALVTATTHDLPTLRGFWEERDLTVRTELDLFASAESKAQDYADRTHARSEMTASLTQQGLLEGDGAALPSYGPDLISAVHRYLAQTRSLVHMVNVEDLIGELEQTNVPGTVDQHPNWRRKLSLTVDGFFADSRVLDVVGHLNGERGKRPH